MCKRESEWIFVQDRIERNAVVCYEHIDKNVCELDESRPALHTNSIPRILCIFVNAKLHIYKYVYISLWTNCVDLWRYSDWVAAMDSMDCY